MTGEMELIGNAKKALERVCSGSGLDPAARYYDPKLVDHVNDLEFHGLLGTEQSIGLYKKAFSELTITVQEQLREGDRVTSRFVVEGTSRGRRVRFNGITLSRFQAGLIVEDWSVTDTLGMLRQLGVWRSLLLGFESWKSLRKATSASSPAQNGSTCAST
jgi:hypothetical protein